MADAQHRNVRLAAVISEAGWKHGDVAAWFVRVAMENGAHQFAHVGRSHVSKWVAGHAPSGRGPDFLREALSRKLGRTITAHEIGLGAAPSPQRTGPDWSTETLSALTDLGRLDVDLDRRSALGAAAYSVAALALPVSSWWSQMADRGAGRSVPGSRAVGRGDLEAVRDMTRMFSRIDQKHGGGHARTAVVQYFTSDVVSLLHGRFTDDGIRRAMFAAAAELAYLAGWMAFDNSEHATAQRYFTGSVKLAAEADDPPMAAHVLRAMAHQAVDLGHPQHALDLAAASVDGRRYALATPRERSLLGVVHARALAATGATARAAAALLRAEDDLRATSDGDDEPGRVFFFKEASLAHETACTLRDSGDLDGALSQFRRSVRTRQASSFARTHAVTLGYFGAVQARQGLIEEACATWNRALDAMDGVRSGRTRQTAVQMRSALSPYRQRGVRAVRETDARAATFLSDVA
ncbi:Tat pathway signal protein [Streptomyces sp. MI02-7b]|uniref:Tat pathway signal protein n=1 Tax=Streptomyces sp. MI02-7b TaxID=462941 RepID=UPI0029ADD07D|nr:Tat pathway signal protein [Streptomyces sp. MI02-7b]MDX3078624.1 Tat pathway signal protein [Streptomyces sp. MI02-7b]